MNKKTEQITVHMTDESKSYVHMQAELLGLSHSETILAIIDEHKEKTERQYQLMKKCFESTENG